MPLTLPTAVPTIAIRLACLALLALSALPVPARASDVYVSYAADGTPTFASQANDKSYVLLLKGAAPASAAVKVLHPARDAADLRKRREALGPLIDQVAYRHGLDPALVRAITHVESRFNANALSPAGAAGLMQLMPATAKRYGTANRMDPAQNLDAGARYFKDLLAQYSGNVALALAAYNAGEGAVQRAGNRVPNYPETRNYVKTVMQLYALLKPAAATAVAGRAPARVRMELPAGGAVGRGNLPTGLPLAAAPNQAAPTSE